ncbi:MAG: hypothetical protein OEX07_04325 [Gammaproteobacteria bacterium]|nr:hypothetical protein [Gammaproteobacteria bacterium]
MTFQELFIYLNENTKYDFITDTSPLEGAINGKHENELIGDIISSVAKSCGCETVDQTLLRQDVVKALGPIRLKYMKDDAPVEGFRLVEGTVPVIDQAFNDEALKNRN